MRRLTGNETREERLFGEIGIVLLKMLLGRRDELDGSKLVTIHFVFSKISVGHIGSQLIKTSVSIPALFKAADDGTN